MKNLSLLFIVFLFLHLTTFAQWTQLADIPTARCFTSSCTIDSNIYVIGGIVSTSSTGPSVGTMEVYDPILDSWDTTKTDMPTSRVEFGACAVNGKIYAIGGATNHGASPFGIVEEYDPSTGNWTTKTPMPTPPRKGAAYGVIDNKIYVAGGTAVSNFTPSNKLEVYDPATDTWIDTLDTMDYPMYSPTGAVINDKFYVIGGLIGSPWTGQRTVQMYDPTIDEWSPVAYLDSGRVGHTTNGVAGYIYAIGGDRQPPIIRNVEEYDPSSNTWTVIDQTPFVKTGQTASVFANKIYLISGSTTSLMAGFTLDSTVYSFDPSYFQDTLHVPADYTTIQTAIDAANNGDIVLVDEDTYYENINYKGKAITVASHFLVDGDSTHIDNTIIDGSQPSHPDTGSVVSFVNDEDINSVLCGFTITGGTGTYTLFYDDRSGGGIFLNQASATICNNIIENNSINYTAYVFGGGIFIHDTTMKTSIIKNNIIKNNVCNASGTTSGGGGITFFMNGTIEISNNKIIDNTITGPNTYGGGIDCNNTDEIYITGNFIKGNKSQANNNGGGGIEIYNCSAVVKNNLIVGNSAYGGGGIFLELVTSTTSPSELKNTGRISLQNNGMNSNQYISKITQTESLLENNTIINNNAAYGGGIRSVGYTPELMNCIVWGNTTTSGPHILGTADVQFSDVEGGYPGTGNIDLDPEFIANDPYFPLSGTSPCIDAGNGDPMYNDVENPNNPGNPMWPAQGTLANDMGHCGGPASLWYLWDWPMPVESSTLSVSEFALMHNYPNPFNPTTTIKYDIKKRTNVELKVFDILGREVMSLINEEKPAGSYEFVFDAANLSSGVYFYRLQAGDFVETKKMMLLK